MTQSRSFSGALRWAFVFGFGRRAIGTIFTFVIAAILGPHDFGLMAIALIYINVLWLVLEQGFMTAIIQRERLEPEHLDSAFWLTIVWCVLLTAAGVATAGLWADLNNEAVLEPVIQVLSVLVLIEGFAIVPQALLRRELRFKEMAIRSNVAGAIGGTTGVVFALAGAGVWALVVQQTVLASVSVALLWALSVWRPRLRFSWRHARELLPFSFGVFLSNLGGFVSQRADALLIGIFFGPTVVGIYRLADRCVEMVLEATSRPVGAVSLTVLSRTQLDQEALKRTTERCLRVTILFTLPAVLVLAACSDELLRVLGDEWVVGADALKLLALAGFAKAIAFFAGPVLFAVSRSHLRAATQWALAALSAGTVVLVGSALVGASVEDQLLGMSMSRFVLLTAVIAPLNLLIISRVTGYRVRELARLLPVPLIAGLAAVLATTVLRELGVFAHLPAVVAVVVSVAVAGATAGGVLVLLEPRVRSLARSAWRRRSESHDRAVPSSGRETPEPAPNRATLSL